MDLVSRFASDRVLKELVITGAFWFMNAVAGGYYADATGHGDTVYAFDDGSAIYTALTKCDEDSWCSGLRDDNLTMVRDSHRICTCF